MVQILTATTTARGKVSRLPEMLPGYYEVRGWDKEGVPTDAKLKELISTYLKLKLDQKEITKRLLNTEQQILEAFDSVGVNEFETPWGVLKKLSDD